MLRFLTFASIAVLTSCAALAAPSSDALIGKPAPGFELPGDDGQLVNLADLHGKRVVLAFFPKAFTPG
ncbi:MAG: redoxin domain-containing protein [Cyanobacteria bacterium REEB65]|nr:redoxin domain-containing protein [Cyanobacteria bacterium REEB65]